MCGGTGKIIQFLSLSLEKSTYYQANLVSIHSDEENHFVVGLFAEGTGWPWIGGLRDPLNPENPKDA